MAIANCLDLDKFIELLGVIAAYSITVKELKTLFAALKGESGRWVCTVFF